MASMEFYNERFYTAKKDYTCDCCNNPIKASDKYWRQVGKFDGHFFTRALHERCAKLVNEYCSLVDNEWGDWSDIYYFGVEEFCSSCPYWDDDESECTVNLDIFTCPQFEKILGKPVKPD